MAHNATATDTYFYQTIDLPGIGLCKGDWDHRANVDAYLGHVDVNGKTVLDVGPANGFFAFEMEKRGALVTAIDLGQVSDWDVVPNSMNPCSPEELKESFRGSVRIVENAFWLAHKALGSRVKLVYGTAYDAPKVVKKVDVALMSNILQHLRDPFLAIQRVSEVVGETIIITETMWNDRKAFQAGRVMEFLPRAESPHVLQSWWHVPSGLVVDILKLLGFVEIRCNYHDEQFNGDGLDPNSRSVPHYTVTGSRTGCILRFGSGWNADESKTRKKWNRETEKFSWKWASDKKAQILIDVESGKEGSADIVLKVGSRTPDRITAYLNSTPVGNLDGVKAPVEFLLKNVNLTSGMNVLEIESGHPPTRGSKADPRNIGFKLYDIRCRFHRRSAR